MSWIKTDWDFGVPYRVFTVGIREATLATGIRDMLGANRDRPTEIEAALYQLVKFWRPNLDGCSIVGIDFGGGFGFRITVVHPSLPRTEWGEMPVEEPLNPNAAFAKQGEIKVEDGTLTVVDNNQ